MKPMELDADSLEIMFRARLLGTQRGQVLEGWAYPQAHALAESGWLRREFQADGELGWFLTAEGDLALDTAALIQSVEGREN